MVGGLADEEELTGGVEDGAADVDFGSGVAGLRGEEIADEGCGRGGVPRHDLGGETAKLLKALAIVL